MAVRGIRGATTVEENRSEDILQETHELMEEILKANSFEPEQAAAVFITVTTDLDADFPAKAIRAIPGWDLVPLMCSTEIPVPGSIQKCIRLMILVNTDQALEDVKHVFLKEAMKLRPDLVSKG